METLVMSIAITVIALASMWGSRRQTNDLSTAFSLMNEQHAYLVEKLGEAVERAVLSVTAPTPINPSVPDPEAALAAIERAVNQAPSVQVDDSDPTDSFDWLTPSRESVAMVSADDPDPFGLGSHSFTDIAQESRVQSGVVR